MLLLITIIEITVMRIYYTKCGEDISNVLNMIGVHPAGVQEHIERPLAENAMVFFNALAEFAYDMDSQQAFRPMQ